MKRIIALILALCLVVTTFAACGKEIDNPGNPNNPVNSGDQQTPNVPNPGDGDQPPAPAVGETWNGYDLTFVHDNGIEYIWNDLDDDTKQNLAAFMNAIKKVELTCQPPIPISEDEAKEFYTLVYNCCTAYTYIGTRFSRVDIDGDGVKESIALPYNYQVISKEEDCVNLFNELDAKLAEIVAGMPNGSEYEKIRYLHDYLIFNCTYGEDANLPFTAYGALVEKNATCQGYADAMHLLLQRAGFETCFVIGRGDNPDVTHKWNYVHLSDGNWYVLDPTWADPTARDDPAYINYDYFLISDEELMKDHIAKFDNDYYNGSYYYNIPVATSMDMSYHVIEGCYVSNYDEAYEAVKKQVAACGAEGRRYVYLRVTDEATYDNIRSRLLLKESQGGSGEMANILAETGVSYTNWTVYRGHKDDFGPLTFVITLRNEDE